MQDRDRNSSLYDRLDTECLILGTALRALRETHGESESTRELTDLLLKANELSGLDRAEMNELLRHGGRLISLMTDPV